eukprot:CAMPEP_0183525198 /NCGR_PEP_ID=MMETSP0371-20130417/20462_1 /TAXON_ID=268820 /ORGANISM="Peridinium aciculiferum, Strain PAER-2" /LENGTH=338 /DNA_ID=CAMNT_0025724405 /DNA_START=1 /DNA_END=1015 /DNA_ORIENTATION=+
MLGAPLPHTMPPPMVQRPLTCRVHRGTSGLSHCLVVASTFCVASELWVRNRSVGASGVFVGSWLGLLPGRAHRSVRGAGAVTIEDQPVVTIEDQPVASRVESDAYEVVNDVANAGDSTAFALRPGAVPLTPPEEEAVQYHIDSFSPGFVVDNILGIETCRKLVDLAEEAGFKQRWNSSLGAVTLYLDEELERTIFERIQKFLPNSLGGAPIGINRRWAVLKYGPGQYMNAHIDGNVPGTMRSGDALKYQAGTRSYMTALFWLADDVVGGETVFTFPQGGIWVKIPPKTGAALFFNHGQNAVSNPLHHGGSVQSGCKYKSDRTSSTGTADRGRRLAWSD